MKRIRGESVVATLTAALAVLTAFWPDWIETLTGLDPDHGDGYVEWIVVVVLACGSIAFATSARRHYVRRKHLFPHSQETPS